MKAITDLTAEELALVQAAREKAEQEKAAKQAQFEKQIEARRATATAAQLVGEKQVKATYDYFSQFNTVGEFEVVEYPLNREIIIKDANGILFKEDYVINSAYIKHIESGRKIRVDEHIIYSKWGRSKNNGYKMFIEFEARAYSKSSTIETKLLNEINSKRAKQNADDIRDAFIDELIANSPIPNTTIEKEYILSNYVSSRNGIVINYDNGSKVICSINVTEKGEAILSVFSTHFPKPKVEGETVMDKLKFISKLEF
jgi:hypothetical protein